MNTSVAKRCMGSKAQPMQSAKILLLNIIVKVHGGHAVFSTIRSMPYSLKTARNIQGSWVSICHRQ